MHQNKQNIANIYESVNPSSKALYCSCTAENHPGHLPFLQSLPYCPEHLNHTPPRKLQHRRSQNTDGWPSLLRANRASTALEGRKAVVARRGSETAAASQRCTMEKTSRDVPGGIWAGTCRREPAPCCVRSAASALSRLHWSTVCMQRWEKAAPSCTNRGETKHLHHSQWRSGRFTCSVPQWSAGAAATIGSPSTHPAGVRHKVGGHRHPGMDGLLGRARGSQEE